MHIINARQFTALFADFINKTGENILGLPFSGEARGDFGTGKVPSRFAIGQCSSPDIHAQKV
jgi:hypothetical protein